MKKDFINQFKSLNKLAEAGGTVIFGGTSDINIPLCELKQAYGLNENYYNRSIENLSAQDASEVYRECISELKPETVFLHIGQASPQFIVSITMVAPIPFINQLSTFSQVAIFYLTRINFAL